MGILPYYIYFVNSPVCYNKLDKIMKIGIEAERSNHRSKTGVEHYARNLIEHLARLDHHNDYTLYLRSRPESWLLSLPKNFVLKVIPFPKFWTQLRVSWEILMHPVRVLFIPASAMPFIHPKGTVVTVHDCAWQHYPESFTWGMRTFLHWSTRFAVNRAKKVIAVSEATKRDLTRFYGVPEHKIAVVLHGYSHDENQTVRLSDSVAQRLPERYVLFLSTLQPRKNLELLIDAFRELKSVHPELPHKLVVAGKPGWKCESILKKIEQNQDLVVYLNHIADQDRWPVYRNADLFVHPSLYEGFGMWILEAFASDVPVAVSGVSSLPEVGGDAALYFDPRKREEIVIAMEKVLLDENFAQSLIMKGRERLKEFSWERCARETLAVLTDAGRRSQTND